MKEEMFMGVPTDGEGGWDRKEAVVTVEGRAEALRLVRESLRAKLQERYANFPFHNPEHSEDVKEGALRFLNIVKSIVPDLVTPEDEEIAEQIALGHDLVQDGEMNPNTGMKVRRRGWGAEDVTGKKEEGNEYRSALELVAELRKYAYPDGAGAFDVKEGSEFRKKIMSGVSVTYPETDVNLLVSSGFKDLKISQQYLGPESSIVDLAIATADLRGPLASDDFEVFRQSGNGEFRELNMVITGEVQGGIETISEERRGKIVQAIKNWLEVQISFATWQKALFEKSVDENLALKNISDEEVSDKLIHAIKNTYLPNMEKNIEETKHRAEKGQVLSATTDEEFRAALREIGYGV